MITYRMFLGPLLRTPAVTPSQSHSYEIICGLGVAIRDIYVDYSNILAGTRILMCSLNLKFKWIIQAHFFLEGQINVIVSSIV